MNMCPYVRIRSPEFRTTYTLMSVSKLAYIFIAWIMIIVAV